MPNEFEFSIDIAGASLAVTFHGLWTIETVEAYARARRDAIHVLSVQGCDFAQFSMLVDATMLGAQPLGSVSEFAETIGSSVHQPRRSALVVSSALFARQGRRMALPNQRVFADRCAAVEWLAQSSDCDLSDRIDRVSSLPIDLRAADRLSGLSI